MVISKIMLKDFKTYKDTVEIKFGGRFNVIIGENNIGKSTIFELQKVPLPVHWSIQWLRWQKPMSLTFINA